MTAIRFRLCWLLCVGMLLPGMARAEAFSDFARDTPVEERSRPRATRILAGAGLGSLAAVAGGVGGFFVAGTLCRPTGGPFFSGLNCAVPVLSAATLGVVLGYPLGVWGGGEGVGGDGRLWATMLGATAGFGAGLSLFLAARTFALWPVGLALGLVGTHLGYELSQPAGPTSALPKRARLQPLLSFSQKGAQMGLGGVF